MMEDQKYHHDPGTGDKGSRWEAPGNEGDIPILGHVISLLSALVSIIGIISDDLGKRK